MNRKLCFGFIIAYFNVLHWITFLQADDYPYFSEIEDPNGSYQFFENQYYKFTTTSRNLFISDQVNSDENLSEVFPSKHISSDEYILFSATHGSPRLNYYFDPNDLDFNGSIEVISYLEAGPIISDDLSMDDYFGYEITFNDWNETIVSAPYYNNGDGAIYIFERNSSNQLSQQSKIIPASGDEGWWGDSILAVEDYMFVGAPNSNSFSGEVIVYQRIDGNYERQDKISDPVTGGMHSFGNTISVGSTKSEIAISPNVEGDKFGRVEIFQIDALGDWIHSQTLWSENNTSRNYFGIDHAQSDEFLIIGAPGESEGQGGRSYIYSKDLSGSWGNDPFHLSSESLSPDDQFGYTVEISGNFAFVGAKQGDGNLTDSGVVYIFNKQNQSWVETAKLVPPSGDGGQTFSVTLEALDDLIVVGSIGVGSEGMAYVYKMHEGNASDWRLISALDNNGSSTTNRSFLPISAKAGMIAIGSPGDSVNLTDGGSFKVFYNDGWQRQNPISLDPLLASVPYTTLDILEDSVSGASYDFQVEHPFENNFTWSVSTDNPDVNTFSISADGNFSYLPEGNFSGVVDFTLEAHSLNGSVTHEFDVNVSAQPDSPVFLSEQGVDLDPVWVGEAFSQEILVFDADGDSLTLTASGMPAGLSMTGNHLSGEITDDSVFNEEAFKDFTILMAITDGTGTPDSEKTFNLRVYSRNSPPLFVNENGVTLSTINLTIDEDCNESDWREALGRIFFQDDNTEQGFTLSDTVSPSHGTVHLDPEELPFPILYSPILNFHGSDSFSIQLDDTSYPTKSAILPFTVTITPVNDPPVITSSSEATWTEGISSTYNITWTDIDGDSNHSVTVSNLPPWMTYDSDSHSLTGTPSSSDYKIDADEVTITVTDSGNLFDSEILRNRVIPLNYPPVFDYEDNKTQNVQEDTSLALVFPFYDLDGSNDITQVSILNEPSNGETEVSISGNEIDFKYYPDGNYSGTDFVEIKIFDPNDLNASDTLSIPINILSVEDYPVFETQPKYTDAVIGYEWIYEFSAVDGDHNQTARILRPQIDSWVSFDLDSDENVSTGILSGTPNLTHLGDYELELVVEDDLGLLGYQVVQINVLGENSPPFINEGESLSIEMVEDSYWEKNNPLSSFDENKQRLTWSIHTEPEFGSISITSNEDDLTFMKYIPQKNYHGTDKVVIELSDGIDSDIFTYQFSILSVDDVPQFLSHNNGDQLTFEDGDQINEVVSFDDGDDDIIKYEIVQKPEWLAVNDDNFSVGELLLTGSPLVQNEGNSSVHIALVDSKNNRSEITIKVKVVVHNYPPSILFNDQNLAINEDSGSTLIGTLSVVDKDQTLGHEWIVIAGPQNGDLQIVQSGEDWTLSYTPDSNFYGTEQIHLRVDDSGTELGLPKNDELIFNIEINSIEDVPYFSSIPPKQVYEDEGLSYVVKVVDGDLPNDDLSITALSLPDWIDFSDFGDGNGLIVGNPKISDAGFHRVDLSVEDKNGSTAIQSFYLEVLVRDFPPVFKSVKTGTTLNKVTLYVKEDQELTEWVNPKGFIAVNPDPEIDDLTKISWYVGEDSQIGSKVEISGEGSRPSSFHYKPPSDFTGVDSFSLFMDEGDRRSELEFEIFVSEVYDPPYFETDLQKKYIVNEGELLDLEISAFDIDSNNLQFRLVGPSWEKDPWLKLIQGSAAKRANLRGTPKVGADGKIFPYTIFVIDDTGLAVNRSITFEVNGANSPPVILPNEIEILFNQKGEPLTRYDSITATDLEGDLLIWSFINAKDDEGNEMRLVNSNGSLPDIRFQPSSLRDNYGPFLLEVSDGLNQDSIAVRAKVDWDKNVTLSGFESLVVIKETQAFSQVLSLNADNFLATPTVGLINAPDWVQLKQIDETRFVIDGVSPLGSAGLYAINLEVLGNGLQSQGVSFDLEVIDPRIPSIELEGSLVDRISYFKPFVDPGYSSMDGRGVDLTEKVEVRESLIDSNGFQELTYFVSDEFQNEAFTKRLVRHYSESPLVLSTQHKKLFAEEVDLSWDENRNLSLIASSYKKLEVGGVEVSQQDLIKNAWISLPPDLTSDRLEVSIEGDEVKLSKIRSNREVTYILGKFLNNLTMDSKKVSSEFKYNLFLVAYTNDQVLKWIQTINSENPIENIGLSILPDNSCIVSGSFTESLNVRSSSITEELKATTESMFFCHYSKDGESVKKVNIALDDNTEVGKVISSDYPQRQIIELLDSSSEIPRSQFKILNDSFEEVDYLSLSSDEEVFINDALFVNENTVFAGGFKGSLFVNEQLLLHSNASAGFLICADLMGNILWAKMFHDDSGLVLPVKLTVDNWGDLIAGIEFSGTVESDLGSLSSVGENDILLMLLDRDDGSTLWQKPFGGTGNEHLHSLKVNSYGSPTIGLTTDVGFYADNLTFTPTAENEFHLVRLLPKTGLPSLEIDSLDLQVFGDFSVPLIGIHSEYLFFDLISAPPWVSLVDDDPSQGKGLLLGSIEHLAKSDLEQDLELTVGVFTMDGGFFEKTMPINFTFDEQAKEELGFLPVANEPFFPKTKGIREIVAVVNDPVSDWLILCRFDDYNTNQRSFLYKVLRLSEAYELTELTSISSANPVNISDLKIDSNGSIFIYGNFSTLLKIGSTNLTARGKSDLFLAEIDPQGQVIRRQRFGNENAEKAGQVLLSEGRVLISGSFENFLTIGSKQVSAVNSSIDGFVAELDRTNFYNVNWVKSFGSEGYDHSPSIIAFEDGQSVVSVIGEGNLEGANLSLDIVPKMFLQLDRLDQNGVSMGTVNFTSSGRINQAMVSPIPNINACVLALEFERDLLWSNGQITSRGGFDIFSTQINDFFNPEYNFSHIGGPWNDRLTDLEVVNANRYLICSKFYQSIQLGDRVIYSQGSSDGLVTKHGLGNHRLLDYYHLSSPGEDEVVSAISVSEKFLIVAGKTDNPQTRISHPFIQKLGDQPKQPMTLKNSNQLLKSSLPFEFTLQTDFWTNRNGDFELSNLDEEKSYHWLEIEVDGRGNLNFSGIAPSVEGIIPLDFNLTENVHEESLNIQFLLEIKIEDNYPPVLQIVDELNVTENQKFDLNFSFYDFEGSPVYLDWTGPNWVSIEKNGKDSALLSIHSTNKVGNHQVRIFASDYLGETSEYQIEIFVQQAEEEIEEKGNDDGNETRSWIEKRIDLENGWSYHLDFGWVYLKEGPDGSTWLWREGWGWLWSENKLWNDDGEGYFYKDSSSSWIFWKPQESDVDNNVYDFEAEQWMKL